MRLIDAWYLWTYEKLKQAIEDYRTILSSSLDENYKVKAKTALENMIKYINDNIRKNVCTRNDQRLFVNTCAWVMAIRNAIYASAEIKQKYAPIEVAELELEASALEDIENINQKIPLIGWEVPYIEEQLSKEWGQRYKSKTGGQDE